MNLDWNKPIIMRWREGKAGGGKGGMYSERSFTIATGNDQVLIIEYPKKVIGTITTAFGAKNYSNDQELREGLVVVYIDGTRVDDVRIHDEEKMQTVIQRWGTGGGNVPAIAFDTQFGSNANTFEDVSSTLKASQQPPSFVETTVRRLTPTECERLQGFPDGWTDGQADSNRYKQMGNAVAVPVVEWIIGRMVEEIS